MGPVEFSPWHRYEARALNDVKQTFSSWDKCMQKAYCKWPAIIGIVIGVLVVVGIAWCIIGCLCCGYTCCRGCCSCCSCCGGGGGGGRQRHKYADPHPPATYQQPPPNLGYQPAAPPVYERSTPQYSSPVPQYAQFDTPSHKPAHEDALPPMPSWQNAVTRRVEDPSQDVEMHNLHPTTGQTLGTTTRSRSGYYEVPSQPSSPRFAPDPYSAGAARTNQNHHPYAEQPPYARSPNASPSPSLQQAYSPYSAAGRQSPYSAAGRQSPGYAAYSPSVPSSPPPPFSPTAPGRQTPGLLQAGRKPVENSWKEV
ncbi:predicted protein [Uncinocarpus reesii 1704]|uniref:Uncharacterized protein n=1 Tax=Uncinocarpus reesii (strain UAMH 1704) TaxID=336963 RepID=C4JFY9_UNCRE|nr:uncharacterized protein UREG_01069 [Uncinocarpus reesii 1704]EEP76220.1 predicted protein [Uncinocarpus reesii 1704]